MKVIHLDILVVGIEMLFPFLSSGLDFIELDVHIEEKQNLISFLDGSISVFGVLNEVRVI